MVRITEAAVHYCILCAVNGVSSCRGAAALGGVFDRRSSAGETVTSVWLVLLYAPSPERSHTLSGICRRRQNFKKEKEPGLRSATLITGLPEIMCVPVLQPTVGFSCLSLCVCCAVHMTSCDLHQREPYTGGTCPNAHSQPSQTAGGRAKANLSSSCVPFSVSTSRQTHINSADRQSTAFCVRGESLWTQKV